MSFRVRDLVLAQRGLPGGQKHVLAALAHWAQDDGSRVYPKVEEVSDRCGMSVRQVQRCTRAMEESGILAVVSKSSGKRGQGNHWRIDLEVLTGARVSICHPSSASTGDIVGSDGCHSGISGVTLLSPLIENDQVSTYQENDQTPRAREPIQRNLNLMVPIQGSKAPYPAGFELIWGELSRCPGFSPLMGKHEAFQAYQSLPDRPTDGELCTAARGYGRHLAAENAKRPAASPHPMLSPANWLSRLRYAQFVGNPEPAQAAGSEPPTLAADCRARLLTAGLTGPEIDAWFAHAEFLVKGDELHLSVRTPFMRNWVSNHFCAALARAWADHGQLSVIASVTSQEKAA